MNIGKISIVIPVYNEEKTVEKLIKSVEESDLPQGFARELILIDDFSTDNTRNLLKNHENKHTIIYHEENRGKGAALRSGFRKITGDVVIIQDADLEYDPSEYRQLLEPIIQDKADVVYGSRFLGGRPHRVLLFWHYLGNTILTFFSNVFTNLNLSDMETCYKVFTRKVLDQILPKLKSDRFGFEPEFTARIAKIRSRVYEVGISYHGRTYDEGKKINWKDGMAAFWHIIRFNMFD